MVLGGIDKIRGNKLGYGREFEEGFKTMGSLVLAVAAVIAVAPFFSEILSPVITPVARAIGADPSFIAGLLLGSDMEDILWPPKWLRILPRENSTDS